MRIRLAILLLCLLLLVGTLLSFQSDKVVIFGAKGRTESEIIISQDVRYMNLGTALLSEGQFSTKAIGNGVRYELSRGPLDVREGDSEVRAGGRAIKLDAAATVREDQAWLPVTNVAEVLRAALGESAVMRPGGRLMIGERGDFIETDFRPGEPSNLTLNFHEAVNPTIHTEEGKVTLSFRREPVVMNTAQIDYSDNSIQELRFIEAGGVAEVVVSGSGTLTARFEDGNKKIVISSMPAAAVTIPPQPPPMPLQPAPEMDGTAIWPAEIQNMPPAIVKAPASEEAAFVAIDPAHGGNDAGVKFSETLLEKDIVLAIAEKVRTELNNRGINSILLRARDQDVSSNERAEEANVARVRCYVAIHAGQMGRGIRVYSQLRALNRAKAMFQPWTKVQDEYQGRSVRFAAVMTSLIAGKKIGVRQLSANTAPLAHIAAAAVSVEVAPAEPFEEVSLQSPAYQQRVAQAIAMAIAQEKTKP